MTIDSAAIRFTDAILGYSDRSIEQTLEAFATDVGLRHISYLRFVSHSDTRLLDTIVTYSMQWQQRYFKKRYALIDPVISWGSKAVVPFDWDELVTDDPVILDFFADAKIHDVGRNGISFPVRNRMGAFSLVSFTSDHSKGEWIEYSKSNISKFQLVSTLIDSAASFTRKSHSTTIGLSIQEEQCMILAAHGKDYSDIAEATGLSSSSVKLYLDTARHKLNCINITHAIEAAIATGAIPPTAVKGG